MNLQISFLKVIATIIVFVCHCQIVCNQTFGFELAPNWQILLKTPAWAAVWIFIFISGYLSGKGFTNGKYTLTKTGILKFYRDRIHKVLLPTYIFISLIFILVLPSSSINLELIIRLLTCTFNGHGGNHAIGATWYVFVLMWLYFITPGLYLLLKRLIGENTKILKETLVLLIIFALLGLIYRVGGRISGLQWYDWIYANVFGCADLYIIGMLTNIAVQTSVSQKDTQLYEYSFWISSSLLILLIIACSVFYFYGESTHPRLLSVYRYITPSLYAVVLFVFIFSSVNIQINDSSSLRRIIPKENSWGGDYQPIISIHI